MQPSGVVRLLLPSRWATAVFFSFLFVRGKPFFLDRREIEGTRRTFFRTSEFVLRVNFLTPCLKLLGKNTFLKLG